MVVEVMSASIHWGEWICSFNSAFLDCVQNSTLKKEIMNRTLKKKIKKNAGAKENIQK